MREHARLAAAAPASTSTGPTGAVTAARCASFSDAQNGGQIHGPRILSLLGLLGDGGLGELDEGHDEAQQHRPEQNPHQPERGNAAECAHEHRKRRDGRMP